MSLSAKGPPLCFLEADISVIKTLLILLMASQMLDESYKE